ncbi:hypothetical protein MRB53_014079 [Persea americana]|uniref:Uncharacterized protein n=1 Tax=Persea americana TaxID=3435 RepID=A0ACC2KAF2_PERAE|nr:hypothetical protein MRB53_014079 [Persea americana]
MSFKSIVRELREMRDGIGSMSRESRSPLHDHSRRTVRRPLLPNQNHGDRFIPNRSSMDLDMAHYLLMDSRKQNKNMETVSPWGEAYGTLLAETLMMNRTRILSFSSKPPTPANGIFKDVFLDSISDYQVKSVKQRRYISKSAERTLDAPEIIDDYYLNLLDWSSNNNLAIALGNTVHLWDASNGSTFILLSADQEIGPVTSVSWAPNGQHIAIGMNSSIVEIWDTTVHRKLRTLQGGHRSRVGSLSWNNHILSTGGKDALIINNDVRIRSHITQTYRGHHEEVCGLKWSGSSRQLASGGNDNLLHIWDLAMASYNSPTQWIHRFDDHVATVKALAWSPFQSNLLASGGGSGDRCIKFWNTNTGACLNSADTGSQVCSLLWSKNRGELLSSHGYTKNQLTLWKYPSMAKITELTGHTSRVLFMAQSPNGCTVASAGADEFLKFWNVFGSPEIAKPATKTSNAGPFTDIIHIR